MSKSCYSKLAIRETIASSGTRNLAANVPSLGASILVVSATSTLLWHIHAWKMSLLHCSSRQGQAHKTTMAQNQSLLRRHTLCCAPSGAPRVQGALNRWRSGGLVRPPGLMAAAKRTCAQRKASCWQWLTACQECLCWCSSCRADPLHEAAVLRRTEHCIQDQG